MAIWPFRKRSKTNSGGKRPTNAVNEESHSHLDINGRPRTPSIRSVSKSKRRTDTLRSIRRAASQRKGKSSKSAQTPSAPSNLRDVQMSSPSPTQTPVAQLQTPAHTPPPSQPAFTPPAHENRRSDSSASSHRPRKRNLLKKAQTFDDTRRSPGHSYPSPPPDKDHPQLFRSFSSAKHSHKRSDSIFRPFSRKQQIDRPLSELSMRTQESLHSMMSFESRSSPLRAFKVRSLDVLSPRPTLRLSSNPYSGAQQKMPDYPSNHERKTSKSGWRQDPQSPIVEETPTLKRNRVYGLADELDSRGIREALERDARRRERKQKEEEAKAQAKLEKRAARQREEEDSALHAFALSQGLPLDDQAGPSRIPGSEDPIPPVTPLKTDAASSLHSPPTGTQTPMSWLHGPSQENLTLPEQGTLEPPPPLRRKSPDGESENEDPVVETATAVRLSGYSTVSTPPSPTLQLRSPKIVDHSPTHSRKMSRDHSVPDNAADEEENEENRTLLWTTFFRKATAARVQREHEAQQEALRERNEGSEARDQGEIPNYAKSNGDSVAFGGSTNMAGTFLQSPTPRSAGSRVPSTSDYFNDNLPTPRQSQPSIPIPQQYSNEDMRAEPVRRVPISPTRIAPSSPLSRNFSEARKPSSKKIKDVPDRYAHHASHLSDVSSRNSVNHERIRSMASIDSEGSWLSGRLNSRQSTHRIPSLRDSAASLKLQYNEVKAYEDRRASVADDQYFSGVQDAESSDEEERDILNSYLDDDVSVQRSSLTSPPLAYRSPPRSPTSETNDDDDSDTDPNGDQYMWRESLGRRPTITRVDSNFVRKREEMGSLYDASSMETTDYSHVPMTGELVMMDSDDNVIVPDRARDSPSPTLGKSSPRFLASKEFHNSQDPFLSAVGRKDDTAPRAS
ncbi:hypothetical protein ABW19_dt0204466 [Dactylella cylindrospora]|nr:hypothetical protein ABW19_dt0204466 [Dactylella cylindrospora]